jgi:hypothetical protein
MALTWWAQIPGEDAARRAWGEHIATFEPAHAMEVALAAVGGSETFYEKYRARKIDFLYEPFINAFVIACQTAAAPGAGGKP